MNSMNWYTNLYLFHFNLSHSIVYTSSESSLIKNRLIISSSNLQSYLESDKPNRRAVYRIEKYICKFTHKYYQHRNPLWLKIGIFLLFDIFLSVYGLILNRIARFITCSSKTYKNFDRNAYNFMQYLYRQAFC